MKYKALHHDGTLYVVPMNREFVVDMIQRAKWSTTDVGRALEKAEHYDRVEAAKEVLRG